MGPYGLVSTTKQSTLFNQDEGTYHHLMSFRTIEDHMIRISWQHVRERKFILFSSNNIRDTYKNYVLYTLKPHNNQLFYAMKMGKPKDAINYRRIIYWRQWQYVLGTICTYYFDHHNNIEIHDIQNNSVLYIVHHIIYTFNLRFVSHFARECITY